MDTFPLPAELIDYVIDFLHDDDKALKSCCLVSRAWVPSSRRHLFRKISLNPPTHYGEYSRGWLETGCHRLYKVLDASSYLASYIEELVICDDSPRIAWIWTPDESSLPCLLRNLTSLRCLSMTFPTNTFVFDNLWPPETLRAVADAVSAMPIEELSFKNFAFHHPLDLMKALRCFPNLKVLHLDNIEFVRWINSFAPGSVILENTFPKVAVRAHPETLTLDTRLAGLILECFIHPRSPISLSKVRHLDLKILKISDHFSTYAELLHHTSSLECLEIQLMSTVEFDQRWDLNNLMDLSVVPHLNCLIIRVEMLLGRSDPLPWLYALFSTVPAENSLKEIFIAAVIDNPPPYVTPSIYRRCLDGWNELDKLLSQPQFSSLERLRIDFDLDDPFNEGSMGHMWEDMVLELQLLTKTGYLEVDSAYL